MVLRCQEAAGENVAMRTLDLSDCRLTAIPQAVFMLTNSVQPDLLTLDLSNNLLKSLPAGLGKFSAVETLSVAHNHFAHLPSVLEKTAGSLRHLNAAHNQLVAIPAEVFACTLIETLDLSHNEIVDIADYEMDGLKALPNLRCITLTGCPLSAGAWSKVLHLSCEVVRE